MLEFITEQRHEIIRGINSLNIIGNNCLTNRSCFLSLHRRNQTSYV